MSVIYLPGKPVQNMWIVIKPLRNISRTPLTHWGRVTHICVSNFTIIGSNNGLQPVRRQAIALTNVGTLIRTSGANFNEILSKIHTYSFKEMHLKMSSAKWQQFCLGFRVLTQFLLKVDQNLTELSWYSLIHCGHMAIWIWVIIGSGNGLLPDAPSLCLNQCCLMIKGGLWHLHERAFTENAQYWKY